MYNQEAHSESQTPIVEVGEPGENEIVIVINDRLGHAGVFVGSLLEDPGGSYFDTHQDIDPTLEDYIKYQLSDGPNVTIYRFKLSLADFSAIGSGTATSNGGEFFCAATVQCLISGVGPFKSIPLVGYPIFPSALAARLKLLVTAVGQCQTPNGKPC